MTNHLDKSLKTSAGYVSIVGLPNAGKSTLLNKIVGSKLAIVSPKAQTTRNRILGIKNHGPTQIVFLDTPGIMKPRHRLDRAMLSSTWKSVYDSDLVIFLYDVLIIRDSKIDIEHQKIINNFIEKKIPLFFVINKIDKINKEGLLEIISNLESKEQFSEILFISAIDGSGITELIDSISRKIPLSPWFYDKDQLTDLSSREIASEITREKLFLILNQELPYSLTVETESWQDNDDGSVLIQQVIFIKRKSQKVIIIGHKGSQIKKVGIASRKELQKIFNCKVHLKLFVKVREDWINDKERYKMIRLDFVE
ncbi:GTPase Era [Alphaproteobacteria bacterium]|nr:GTPase Era [Alphaproteobacteria bacterium]